MKRGCMALLAYFYRGGPLVELGEQRNFNFSPSLLESTPCPLRSAQPRSKGKISTSHKPFSYPGEVRGSGVFRISQGDFLRNKRLVSHRPQPTVTSDLVHSPPPCFRSQMTCRTGQKSFGLLPAQDFVCKCWRSKVFADGVLAKTMILKIRARKMGYAANCSRQRHSPRP